MSVLDAVLRISISKTISAMRRQSEIQRHKTPSRRPRLAPLARHAAAAVLVLALGGCSPAGPPRGEIKNALQAQLAPWLEVKSLESEFVPTGKDAGVVRIKAELRLTEALFENVPRPTPALRESNDYELSAALLEAGQADAQVPQEPKAAYDQAEEAFATALREAQKPVLRMAQKSGDIFPLSAKANVAKEFDEWKIASFQGDQPQLAGQSRNSFPANALMEGDPQIEEQNALIQKAADARKQARQKLVEAISAAMQAKKDAIAAQLADQEAQAAKAIAERRAKFKEALMSGPIYGFWNTDRGRGDIGIRFDKFAEAGEQIMVEGSLLNPKAPQETKRFTGTITGDGTEKSPHAFRLNIEKGNGVVTDKPLDWRVKENGSLNRTTGLLVNECQYNIKLTRNHDSGDLSGIIEWLGKNVFVPTSSMEDIKLYFSPASAVPESK